MKCLSLLSVLFIFFSTNSYAEVCEGFNACTNLYTQLTGQKISIDKNISDETSLAVQNTDLTKENAKAEYQLFLNKNTIDFKNGKLNMMRNGEFLTAPIYIVSESNMPQMINKDGLVTLVYHAQKASAKSLSSKTRQLLSFSKVKTKAHFSILEFPTKIIAVSHTFEYATKIMKEI